MFLLHFIILIAMVFFILPSWYVWLSARSASIKDMQAENAAERRRNTYTHKGPNMYPQAPAVRPPMQFGDTAKYLEAIKDFD